MLMNTSIFGSGDVKMENTLKNPNQYREAVIYETLSTLSSKKIREFVKSPEAKTMLEEGIITQDTLERLVEDNDTGCLKTTVCHMAKENGDPLWDELVKCRIQERRLMNELLEKYQEEAKLVVESANSTMIEKNVPTYFRNND